MGEDQLAALPEAWTVWSDGAGDDGRLVLGYRPDVFDTDSFPPPCMPTLYVTRGPTERRRPPGSGTAAGHAWHVTLYLEPEVNAPGRRHDRRGAAVRDAVQWAAAFDRGEVDYRDLYQVPRDAYLDRLDELTGRGEG